MNLKTLGISPKAVLAFLLPLIAAVVGSAGNWAVGGFGHFDSTSIVIAATGLGASGLALLGAYVGKPGVVVAVTGAGTSRAMTPLAVVPDLPDTPMGTYAKAAAAKAAIRPAAKKTARRTRAKKPTA